MDAISTKRKAVLERIASIERAIVRGREYLESGAHAHWHGFAPHFREKRRDGHVLPPHPDWVRNFFLPRMEQVLRKKERALERLSREPPRRRRQRATRGVRAVET